MEPATIVNGTLLAQFLLCLIMFIAAEMIRPPRSASTFLSGAYLSRGFSWEILSLLLISMAALIFSDVLSASWAELFKNTNFSGIKYRTAILVVFLADIIITTRLVDVTGGSVDSPFQPIFFLIPTLAILLSESSGRVIIYSLLVSIAFIALLYTRPTQNGQAQRIRSSYGFVSVSCLALTVLIGLLTRG